MVDPKATFGVLAEIVTKPHSIALNHRQKYLILIFSQVMEVTLKGSDFQLRTVTSNDLDAVFDLFAQVQSLHSDAIPGFFRPPEKDETFEQFFEGILNDPEQHLVFACVDGMQVGYIQYFLGSRPKNVYQPERRFAYIHHLAVGKEHRRAGCASMLIEHVLQEARRLEIAQLGIDFWSFNSPARACFEKAGFKVNHEAMWLNL
jgi:ribosomal protein S18 acetylase RimI-like enzyme